MSNKLGGRVAVYIEGHAESLEEAAGKGDVALDKLGVTAERTNEKVALGSRGFASYSSATSKSAKTTEAATTATEEHEAATGKLTGGLKEAAVGAGGFIAAFAGFEALKGGIEYTEELVHETSILTQVTGLDATAASQWIELAKQRGIQASQVGMAFGTLSKQIKGAEEGSTSSAKAFHAMGIPLDELRHLSTEEVLLKISDGLKNTDNSAQRAALNQQFFGKSARALLPVLGEGSQAVEDQLGKFKGLSEGQMEQGEKAIELQRKVSRVYDEVRTDVTFALLSAGEATAGWIKETAEGKGVVGEFGEAAVGAFDEIEEGQGKVGGFLHNVIEDGKSAIGWIDKATGSTVQFAQAVFHGEGGEAGSIIRTVATDFKNVELWAGKAWLTAAKFEVAIAGGAIKAAPGVFNAVVGAVKGVANWVTTAGHNVSQFAKDFIPFKVAVIGVKVALAPLVIAIKGTIKVIEILMPAIKGAAAVLKTAFVAALHVTAAAIQVFLKVVGDIGSVIGDVVGLVSNLLRGHWGNAWADAKQIVVDSLHTIEDLVKGVWTVIKTAFSGGMSVVKSVVKHGFNAVEGVVSNAENALDGAFTSSWDAIKGTFEDGVNDVIGFLDTLASVIEKIPGVPDLQIPKITVGGSGTRGGSGGPEHQSKEGYARGGHVTRPMFMVGEEAPQHPEWVIATNPAYRKKNVQHWAQAGHDLGIPGFALGGLTETLGGAASSAFNAAKSVGSDVINSAKVAIGDLPTPHLPSWMGSLGSYVVNHVANWITSGFSSGKLGEQTNVAGGLSGSRFKIGAEELKRISAPNVVALALFEALVDEGGPNSNVLEGEGSGEGAPIMSAAREISGFLTGSPTWTGTSAMSLANSGEAAYEIAQDVQASGAGKASHGLANYGSHQHEAESLLRQYGVPGFKEGGSPTRAVAWARNNIGTNEGSKKQLKWAGESGLGDDGPWCASFVSADLAAQGVSLPSNPNSTGSFEEGWSGGENVGSSLSVAKPGDLLGFSGEHIGIYVGGGKMISGNWGNTVAEANVSEDEHPLTAVLRPNYPNGSSSSLSGSTEKKAGPATKKQEHRIGFLAGVGSKVAKEVRQAEAEYAKHGGTKAGKKALERAHKFAHMAAVAHKAGNTEHAKALIEKSEAEIEKARSSLGTANKNVYTAGLKSSPLGEAAKALPKNFRELLKLPGITSAQKLQIGEEASSLASETEGEADDKAAAKFNLGLLKKDKQATQKRLKEIAARLKKGGLTKAQRGHLVNEQATLASQLSTDDQGINSARSTLRRQPESEEEEESNPVLEAVERQTEAIEKAAEEQKEREEQIEANQEAILALQHEEVEGKQRTIALLESQSGPNGVVANALAAVISGQIGGKVGLGFATPGVAGKVADY